MERLPRYRKPRITPPPVRPPRRFRRRQNGLRPHAAQNWNGRNRAPSENDPLHRAGQKHTALGPTLARNGVLAQEDFWQEIPRWTLHLGPWSTLVLAGSAVTVLLVSQRRRPGAPESRLMLGAFLHRLFGWTVALLAWSIDDYGILT